MKLEQKVEQLILESREITFDDNKQVSSFTVYVKVSPKLLTWYKNCEEVIFTNGGIHSQEWQDFEKFEISNINGHPRKEFDDLKSGVVGILRALVTPSNNKAETSKQDMSNEIFIVHGHNELVKQTTARTLTNLGLKPIILHEEPNGGKTIIEKFESKSINVGYAIILLTNDDDGKAKSETTLKARARQNVIFEMGYFIGKLERNRVFLLLENGVEKPGDLDGIVYTEIDPHDGWKLKLVRELKAANYNVSADNL